MTQIVLSDEQARAVQSAVDSVEVRDQHGQLLGYVSRPLSAAEVAEAEKRLASDGPWYTTEQVIAHLDSLEQG